MSARTRRTLVAGALAAWAGAAAAETVTFAEAPLGKLPDGFEAALTGKGSVGAWAVVEEPGGRALEQTTPDPTDYRFPLAIYAPATARDVEVRVRFKAISGKVDQAGGIAVRLRDPNNYYVARANALEDNVRFYRVVAGRREQLAGADTRVTSGEWHTLALRAEGDRFSVSFDGRALFTANDRTFGEPGRVALWTKADSVTRFEALEINPLPREGTR